MLAPGSNVGLGTFTVAANGPGDTTITWPEGALPPPSAKPEAPIDTDRAFLAPVALPVGNNGVRVKTRDAGGALADADFTVKVF